MEQSIIGKMLQEYDRLTKSEKKIADYVYSHRQETQYISITDLSAACQVAVATISVFCRKLGLSGFNDFKLELAKADAAEQASVAVKNLGEGIQEDDSAATVMRKTLAVNQEALHLSYQLLKEADVRSATRILEDADIVLCMGQGNSSAVATATWTQFSTISPKFKTIQDSHLQTVALSTLSEKDAVLYFSYSGATNEVMAAAELIRACRAKLILVTRYANAPAAAFADVVLLCGPNEDPLQFGSTAALISQLYVVDVLLGQFCKHNREQVEKYRAIVGKALMKKQL